MIELTAPALRQIWPKAPQGVIDAFLAKQAALAAKGINTTRTRLAIALAEVEHETNGYAIPNLTENINYTAERAAQIWPSRFKSAAAVSAKYGSAPGWQRKMFDDVYGNRMGNRPGTDDGSRHIGRGGPQITGRDGYVNTAKHGGVPIDRDVELATKHELQPEILAGFWGWKNFNPVADAGGLRAVTKLWNGAYIGMADREARLRGNDPAIKRLAEVERIRPILDTVPGTPPPLTQDTIDATTKKERATRKGGGGGIVLGGGNETAKVAPGTKASTEQPDKPAVPLMPTSYAVAAIGIGIAIVVIASILIARKKAAVVANWK